MADDGVVTPRMLAVGAHALNDDRGNPSSEDLVEKIYRAMLRSASLKALNAAREFADSNPRHPPRRAGDTMQNIKIHTFPEDGMEELRTTNG